MEEKLLQDAVDAVVQTPITLHFDIAPKNRLHERLQKWGVCKKKKSFALRPLVYGNLLRVAKLWLQLGMKTAMDRNAVLDGTMTIMATQTPLIAEMIAVIIHNRKSYPPQALADFILYNITQQDAKGLLKVVLKQIDIETFLSGLVSLRGLNVLPQAETGPTAPGA